jgi:threonine/homoserine/homoserine lactone efflux protein
VTLLNVILAISLLLVTPGPTNTLMALGGYERGWMRALPLIGAELGGYLSVIVPIATLASPFFEAYPQAAPLAKLLAGAWVLYLSYRLWTAAGTGAHGLEVSGRKVGVTTLLNPKALIIALVIMPHDGLMSLLPRLGVFACLVVLAANGWILFGSLMRRSDQQVIRPLFVQRGAAACLLLFATFLAGSSLQSLA